MSPIPPPPPPPTHHQIELFFTLQELKKISISVFLNEKNELNPSRPRRPWNERMSERERESEVARENSMSCKRQPYTNTHRHREVAPREQ